MRVGLLLLVFAAVCAQAQSVEHPLPIGGDVKAPALIHEGNVVLPEMWRGKLHSVYVELSMVVDEQGSPRNVVVRKSNLSEEWWAEVKKNAETQYRFRPATLHGTPVAVRLGQEIDIDGL
jgi:hypothetical protein